jgi:PKHD-type hydroxylase
MLVPVDKVLDAAEVAAFRARLADAPWTDGRITAGHQSAQVKRNIQLPADCAVARELSDAILAKLERHALFVTAALPRRVFPPLFNRYDVGMGFGNHIDNALRGERDPIRTDISATLFLSDPDEYDGGELVVEDLYGTHAVKLPAGSLVLYPSSSVHRVETVTRGSRVAAFFWIMSLVRDAGRRRLLLELDLSIQRLRRGHGELPELVDLSGVYHNLLREWAEP